MSKRWLSPPVLCGVIALTTFLLATDRADATPWNGRISNFRGAPVKDARVALVADDPQGALIETVSDAEGKFRLDAPLLPMTILVSADGFSPQVKQIESKHDLESIHFRLLPGRRQRVQVVDQAGSPVDGVHVRSIGWQIEESKSMVRGLNLSVKSDPQGNCVIESLPASTVVFEFRHSQFETGRHLIQAGSQVRKIVLLPRGEKEVIARLDERAKQLRYKLDWSLSEDEPSRSTKFVFQNYNFAKADQQADGLAVSVAHEKNSQGNELLEGRVATQVTLSGDFDVEADMETLDWGEDGGNASLVVALTDRDYSRYEISHQIGLGQGKVIAHQKWQEDDITQHEQRPQPASSEKGTLRIARRGPTFYALWRAEPQDDFDLIDQREINQSDTLNSGVYLSTTTTQGGQIRTLWKRVRIRSESMFDHSIRNSSQFALSVYDYQTNDIKRICSVTRDMRTVSSPCWSPDEKWIAYESQTGSDRDSRIMIVWSGGGTPKDIGAGSIPSFSPDGGQIAFSSATDGLGVMNVDGSDRIRLDHRGWDLQWTPAGNLSYSAGGQFHLIDPDGNWMGPLMAGAMAERYDNLYWNSTWSHDGKRIVFKGRRASDGIDEFAIWSMDAPEDVIVLLDDVGQRPVDFSWSPDDAIVHLISRATVLQQPIVGFASDGSGVTRPAPQGIDYKSPASAVWSPSGTRVAITGEQSKRLRRQIYRMTPEGNDLFRVTNRFMGDAEHLAPAIASDGKGIVFELYNGKPSQSRIIQFTGHDSPSVDLGQGVIPSFSQDGKRILYSSNRGMKSHDLASGKAQSIDANGTWGLTASPVSDHYASIRNYGRNGANIVIDDGQGSEPRHLLEGEHQSRYEKLPSYFTFSPDGSSVAFIGHRKAPPGRELAVVSTQGSKSGFQVVANASDLHNDLAWRPDGRHLVVAREDSHLGYMQLYKVPIDDGENVTLIPGQPPGASNREPTFSRDGKYLYFSSKPFVNR